MSGGPNTSSPGESSSNAPSTSEPMKKKAKYNPPSLFESLRREPKVSKKFLSKKLKAPVRLTQYVRDILLLPSEFKGPNNNVSIPRSKKRTMLAQAGLVGKIELNSGMNESDVREEVCEVFSQVMGLTEDDIKNEHFFQYVYLQRAGAGSRTLCVPSVKESFKWNGKKVATLAKSGGVIYILAQEDLPGWGKKVLLSDLGYQGWHKLIVLAIGLNFGANWGRGGYTYLVPPGLLAHMPIIITN